MSWRRPQECFDQLEEAVNRNDTVVVERIARNYVTLGDGCDIRQGCLEALCTIALKNKCLPNVKLLFTPESMANNMGTCRQLMKAAIESNFAEGVKFLHSKGVPLYMSQTGTFYWSALVECVETNKVGVLNYLLGLKDLDKNPDKSNTLLMLCCQHLNIESLKILLNSELINTINQQTKNFHQSVLHVCIVGGYCYKKMGRFVKRKPERVHDCVQLLVDAGADINLQDIDGKTPIQIAAERGMVTTVMYLAQREANLDSRSHHDTLLHSLAKRYGISDYSDECVQLLIMKGVDINKLNSYNETPLYLAVCQGNVEMAKSLIKSGCNVNIKVGQGVAPILLESIRRQETTIAEMLIKAGCDVNSTDTNGITPLMTYVKMNNPNMVNNLLNAGADVNLSDNDGRTALMAAARNCNRPILEYLLNAGADVNKTDTHGRSAIHGIMVGGDKSRKWIKCLKLLLINKCHPSSLDTPGEDGKTLFQWLLEKNKKDLIWYLVTENCSLKGLDLSKVKDKFQFSDMLMHSEILFESGAPKSELETIILLSIKNDILLSVFNDGLSLSAYKSMLEESKDKQLDEFRCFCKSRSLKSRCRREIRNCIGSGISSKISQVGLPKCLQDYVVMKDLIPEKYFTLVIND
ncbi:putative ankyrin repeat protein RF_0381 [Patella vulgata]|uniref:putative ankyrin repeat protein RF_0381 n=1 Tax=Patella vulgata TaxID=6465 RepID=UPI0024A86E6D|nr:putative ankyrin repeat protein RF_0381 [Patella vulgata]